MSPPILKLDVEVVLIDNGLKTSAFLLQVLGVIVNATPAESYRSLSGLRGMNLPLINCLSNHKTSICFCSIIWLLSVHDY